MTTPVQCLKSSTDEARIICTGASGIDHPQGTTPCHWCSVHLGVPVPVYNIPCNNCLSQSRPSGNHTRSACNRSILMLVNLTIAGLRNHGDSKAAHPLFMMRSYTRDIQASRRLCFFESGRCYLRAGPGYKYYIEYDLRGEDLNSRQHKTSHDASVEALGYSLNKFAQSMRMISVIMMQWYTWYYTSGPQER